MSTLTDPAATAPKRPLRADAARNRDRLLEVAAATFSEKGADVPLEEIASGAGVGIGTLYRNFPTREALVAAVYRHEVEVLCARGDQLLADQPPADALAAWMQLFVAHVRTKRGMLSVLKPLLASDSTLIGDTRGRAVECAQRLLAAGVAAGTVRADVDGADVVRAVSGICMSTDQDTPVVSERLVGVIVDGLRVTAPAAKKGKA